MSLNGSPKWMYNAGSDFYSGVINQSLRVQNSHYLERTPSSAGNQSTWTFSAWIKRSKLGTVQHIWTPNRGGDGSNESAFRFNPSDKINIYDSGSTRGQVTTKARFRDVGHWYHIVVQLDLTNSTANDRVKIYVNGVLQEKDVNNAIGTSVWGWNATRRHRLGGYAFPSNDTTRSLDGYMAEVNFIDGSVVAPTAFAETKEGLWIPKEATGLSYGTNGFRMTFADSSDIGNNANSTDGTNDFTTVTGVTAHDVVADTPENNFCTLNDTSHGTRLGTVSDGALQIATSTNNRAVHGTMSLPSSGKWYYEVRVVSYASGGGTYLGYTTNSSLGYDEYSSSKGITFSGYNEQVLLDGSGQSGGYGSNGTNVASNGDIYSILLDVDNSRFYYAKNGTYFNSANPASGTGGLDVTATLAAAITDIVPTITRGGSYNETYYVNFGQDGTFGGAITAGGNADGNGHGNFKYAVPSGFLSLCTSNLPNPAKVADPLEGEQASDYFVTTLYTGTNTTNEKNIGFAPDLLWFKHRNGGSDHVIYDTIRGANSGLSPNNANGQNTSANSSQDLMSFDNDGFTVGVGSQFGSVNSPGHTIASWAWKGGGTAVSNSNGSITSSVSANTDAGFSVVSYTGNGGSSATVGHGLTQAPDCIWGKHRTAGEGWVSFWNTPAMGPTKTMAFNSTGAAATSSGEWNNTAPTNTVFTIGNQGRVNTNNAAYIMYCFHNVEGYCKVGQYTGNGQSDGPMVYCGFRPAWILIRRTASGSDWCIYDSKRLGYNVDNNLQRIAAGSEQTDDDIDLYSNGFKFRRGSTNFNGNGNDHVFIAFAEQPFKYANAR